VVIKIQVIQDHIVKLNINQYILEYLKLLIEAQQIEFKSNICEKILFPDNRFYVCKLRKFVKVLDYRIVNSSLNSHTRL